MELQIIPVQTFIYKDVSARDQTFPRTWGISS